jgi:geranylgeranyl diphosphate synthase, type I
MADAPICETRSKPSTHDETPQLGSAVEHQPLDAALVQRFPEAHAWAIAQIPLVQAIMANLSKTNSSLSHSVAYQLGTGGKFFRARLALACCYALGVRTIAAAHLGAACELIHNASLVHDDIQDGDIMRRGHPSVWCQYGINTAITLGDFFHTLGYEALAEINILDSVKIELLRLVNGRTIEMINGQVRDIELRGQTAICFEEYESVAREKTTPLLSLPVEGALVLAGANHESRLTANTAIGWFGIAYQVQDDLLDFFGQKGRNTAASDFLEGKLNAVLLHYLASVGATRSQELAVFLRKSRQLVTEEELIEWITRIKASSALESTARHVHMLYQRSRTSLRLLPALLAKVVEDMIDGVANQLATLIPEILYGVERNSNGGHMGI